MHFFVAVDVDMARKNLWSGESSLALCCGVNMILHPFTPDKIKYVITPDGRCKNVNEKAEMASGRSTEVVINALTQEWESQMSRYSRLIRSARRNVEEV